MCLNQNITKLLVGIIRHLNCDSSNIIYILECLFVFKPYVGEGNNDLHVGRSNGYRYTINSKTMLSTLFTHLLDSVSKMKICSDHLLITMI